ncbi:hypothetical protein ASA1KI_30700 [Opitutales bacterium ASA1]|uniref:glucoamylase family protein n=1 Tax=Congregicoccus parvus TaxID=3081749 RepID=UPI002B27DAC0|nr:hypothetical protein ASA1KI_30700 [Opitutales bacterium ASA1]
MPFHFHPTTSLFIVSGLVLFPASSNGAHAYDEHVVFDNAPARGRYHHSEASFVAPSRISSENGRLHTTRARFVSPPNALLLEWTSAPGGDWRATIRDPGRDWRTFVMQGDAIAFWCWSEHEITSDNCPRVYLMDGTGKGTPSLDLVHSVGRIPAREWTRITLPFGTYVPPTLGTAEPEFRIANTVSMTFVQGLDDSREHRLFIDDVSIVHGDRADAVAPSAPAGAMSRAFERHFDVSWTRVNDPDVLSYRIYRAWDDGPFEPIGTQRNAWSRFVDYTGPDDRRARHRVSAIDLAGNESELSPASAPASLFVMNDEQLLDMVQEGCFRYYWEAGHPNAGLAPEILPGDEHLIATGGNGFGIMAMLVAIERGFITRDQGVERMAEILRFLDRADRFKGVWPHFLDGRTGRTVPFFGRYDDGGDLVESAFVMQALLTARQYFDRDDAAEREIRATVTRFWHEMEWSWFRKTPDSDVLYWHWSENHGFHISHPLIGWNETLIVYLLAIASPTHAVPPEMYHTGFAGTSERHRKYRQGWSRTRDGDSYVNGKTHHGIRLDVGVGNGAELFFLHFNFMGFDPRGIRDAYTNYFDNSRAIALVNRAYCIENPRGMLGYGPDCWGRSAGVNSGGGRAMPRDDNGTINVMASLASMPYTPEESMAALRHFYRNLGDRIWGIHGFHDGFNETWNWFDPDYMALNQGPIVGMIENHRTGLLWRLFMANPEIASALAAIGFRPDGDGPVSWAWPTDAGSAR